MRWLWAAYLTGVWKDLLTEGLSRDEFAVTVADLLGAVDHDWIFEVQGEKGLQPIGLVTADNRFAGHGIEVHADWFPWASARNILESTVQFLIEKGRDTKIHLYVEESYWPFWQRVWEYKVIKKGCKIHDCYGMGEHAMYYNTPGPFK